MGSSRIAVTLPLAALATLTALGGCATDIQTRTANLFATQEKGIQAQVVRSQTVVAVPKRSTMVEDYFVDPTPLKVAKGPHDDLPPIFKSVITISKSGAMSLFDLVARVTEQTGLLISFAPDVSTTSVLGSLSVGATQMQQQLPQSLSQGPGPGRTQAVGLPGGGVALQPSVGQATSNWAVNFDFQKQPLAKILDVIAARENLTWRWTGTEVEFRRYMTKTFVIDALAGKSEISARVQGNTSAGSSGGSSGAGGAGSGAPSTTTGQTTSFTSNTSIWDGIKGSVEKMLSDKGKVYVSEATGTVTVKDVPSVVATVEEFVKHTNRRLSRKVYVSYNVYTVQEDENSESGINWAMVWQNLASKYNLSLSTPALTAGIGTFSFKVNDPAGLVPWNNSQAVFGALAKNTRTSLYTSSQAVTLSGRTVPIQKTTQQNYIASVSSVAIPNAGNTTTINQSTVVVGFSINMTPLVTEDGQVQLRTAMDLSTLDSLISQSSGGQTVQIPTVSSQNMMNEAKVASGETLILVGFGQMGAQTNGSGLFTPGSLLSGGSARGGMNRANLVVVITPVVGD